MPLENIRSISVCLYCCSFVIPYSSSDQSLQGLTFRTTKFTLLSRFSVVYSKNKNVFAVNSLKHLMKITHKLEGWCLFNKKEKTISCWKMSYWFWGGYFYKCCWSRQLGICCLLHRNSPAFQKQTWCSLPFVMLENITKINVQVVSDAYSWAGETEVPGTWLFPTGDGGDTSCAPCKALPWSHWHRKEGVPTVGW